MNIVPMIADEWLIVYFQVVGFTFWLSFLIGVTYSGIHKCGIIYWWIGLVYYGSYVGTWVSGCTESTTLCYFLFFVDKFKLEFKVINKDKPINE